MTFEQAKAYINSLQSRGWRLGLDRMQKFLEKAGLSPYLGLGIDSPRYIHVAGTNGKGSVTAFVQSLLVEQGWRTGAAFSPYVFDVRERVQLARNLIPPKDFARHTKKIIEQSSWLESTDLGSLTEFEFKTALGFSYWAEQGAEWVALEVGLGGRFDATNVVIPATSVIVSIGLDHTQILGNTYAEIAREKAGIIKRERPLIVGKVPREALVVIENMAKEIGAPIWRYGQEIQVQKNSEGWEVSTPTRSYSGLEPQLIGASQPHNMALAIAACEVAGAIREPAVVCAGISKAWLPGRYQAVRYKGHQITLDGAHNTEAVKNLVETIKQKNPNGVDNWVLLTNMVQGHEPSPFYKELSAVVKRAHFAPIDFPRAYQPADIAQKVGFFFDKCVVHNDLQLALDSALADASDEGHILVTGSFYLLGDLGSLMGLNRMKSFHSFES